MKNGKIGRFLPILCLLITVIFVFFARKHFLAVYFDSPYIGGWDSATHFEFFRYYAKNIFPGFFAWIPTWYSGMPFPQFYPPLFFYVYSIINNYLFIITESVFKVFQVASYMITPIILGLLYYFGYKKDKWQATLVIIFSFLLSALPITITEQGFGFASTLKMGLITQTFSFPILLAWIFFTEKIRQKNIYQIISIFLLTVLLLTNIHSAFTCLIIYTLIYFRDVRLNIINNKKVNFKSFTEPLKIFLIDGSITLLLISFWYLPMLSYLNYSTARPLDYPFNDKNWFLLRQSYQLVVPLIVLFINRKKRKFDLVYILSFYSIITYLVNIIGLEKLINIPLHSERMMGASFLLFPIILIELIELLWKNKKTRNIIAVILIAVLGFLNIQFSEKMLSFGLFIEYKNVDSLLAEINKHHGDLFLVEPPSVKESVDALINAKIGAGDNRTVYSILRESSISSIFFNGIRNSFSETPEYWSIRSRLAVDAEYLDRNITSKINDAIKYGVTNIVVHTDSTKKELAEAKNDKLSKVGQYDGWDMYRLNTEIKYETKDFEILQYKPTLIISDLDAKNYRSRSVDFISVAEEMLRVSFFDFRFVHADKKDLGKIDYNDFGPILLEDKYLVKHPEILNILIDKKLANKIFVPTQAVDINKYKSNSKIIPYESPRSANDRASYIKFFINFLYQNQVQNIETGAKDISFMEKDNIFTVVNNSNNFVSLVLKRSYFPTWQANSGNVYMINPSFMYVTLAPRSSKIITFNYPKIFWRANYVSLLGIFLFGIYAIFLLRKKIIIDSGNKK